MSKVIFKTVQNVYANFHLMFKTVYRYLPLNEGKKSQVNFNECHQVLMNICSIKNDVRVILVRDENVCRINYSGFKVGKMELCGIHLNPVAQEREI